MKKWKALKTKIKELKMGYFASLTFPLRERDPRFQERGLKADNDEEAIEEAKALVKKLNDAKRKAGDVWRYGLSSVQLHKIVKDYKSWTDEETRKEMK